MGNQQGTKRSRSIVASGGIANGGSSNLSASIRSNPNILVTKTNPINDEYFILKNIGEGANGKVLLCQNKLDKTKYALKKLIDDKNSRREIELQWRAALNCNHIVKIKDVYENKVNGKRCLLVVMEYMEGGELFDRLKRKKRFTENEVAKIMIQICTAVNHLHTMGIAHRDLKPENLLIKSKDGNLIKLSDFGFAKEAHKGLTTPNFTPYYVAPEILSFEKYDISCDIWSLGVIMYILCCGYPPFYSTHGKAMSPGMKSRIISGQFEFPPAEWLNVSAEAKQLIAGMLETVPERRLTIKQVMSNKWLLNYTNAPKTRLNSIKVLKREQQNWSEYVKNMSRALEEMRVNYDRSMVLKNIEMASNPLLKRRLEKNQLGQGVEAVTSGSAKRRQLEDGRAAKQPGTAAGNGGGVGGDSAKNSGSGARKKSSPMLKRILSAPASRTPLTAFYYTSNLKGELPQADSDELFLNSSFA